MKQYNQKAVISICLYVRDRVQGPENHHHSTHSTFYLPFLMQADDELPEGSKQGSLWIAYTMTIFKTVSIWRQILHKFFIWATVWQNIVAVLTAESKRLYHFVPFPSCICNLKVKVLLFFSLSHSFPFFSIFLSFIKESPLKKKQSFGHNMWRYASSFTVLVNFASSMLRP